MDFIEDIGIRKECPQAGIRAEQNGPAAIFDAWVIGWICIAENPPTQGHEFLRARFLIADFW